MHTLDDQLLLSVVATAHRTAQLAVTRAALCVVAHPVTTHTGGCGTTVQTPHTPDDTQYMTLEHSVMPDVTFNLQLQQ